MRRHIPRLLRTYPGLKPPDYDDLWPAEIAEIFKDLEREDLEIRRQQRERR